MTVWFRSIKREHLWVLVQVWSVLGLFWAIDVLADKWPPRTLFGLVFSTGWILGVTLDLLFLGPAISIVFVVLRGIYRGAIGYVGKE